MMILKRVETFEQVGKNFVRFQTGIAKNQTLAREIVNRNLYWVFDERTRTFATNKFLGFQGMDFAKYEMAQGRNYTGDRFNGGVAWKAIERAVRNGSFRRDDSLADVCWHWGLHVFGDDAWGNIQGRRANWKFLRITIPATSLSDTTQTRTKRGKEEAIPSGQPQGDDDEAFDAENHDDKREFTETAIAVRRGQTEFRRKLLQDFWGRCVITGCDAESALEAAHIVRFLGVQSDNRLNGLLLRADIHTLFDEYLIGIHPDSFKAVLAPRLQGSHYDELNGKDLSDVRGLRRRMKALKQKWKKFDAANASHSDEKAVRRRKEVPGRR